MQCMTEFVEQRARIIKREQGRFTSLWFRKIHHVVNDRLLSAVKLVARLQGTHPCARTL